MKAARDSNRRVVRWWSAFIALLVVIALTGLTVVDNAHQTRGIYQTLGRMQGVHDELLSEHSRLLLERGAIASLQGIEEVAVAELDMEFPKRVGEVLQ